MIQNNPTRPVSAAASLKARLSGTFGRLEISDIVLGALCLILISLGLVAETHSSQYAGLLIIGGFAGAVLIVINRMVQNWRAPTGPARTEALVTPEGTYVSTIVANPKELVLLIRKLVQGRQKLPPAQGEVITGDPSDATKLHEFTPEERDADTRTIEAKINEHDDQLMAEVRQLAQLQEIAQSSGVTVVVEGRVSSQHSGP